MAVDRSVLATIYAKEKAKEIDMQYVKVRSIMIVLAFLAILGQPNAQQNKTGPIKFLKAKEETRGKNKNRMELYSYSGAMDAEALKRYILIRKASLTGLTFYFAVFFDDAANAAFPETPFTAEYGTEDNRLRHIRAYYTYNSVNKYSNLDVYSKNKLESPAKSITVK